MLDELRKPFFIIALVLIVVAVLLEMGSGALVQVPSAAQQAARGHTASGFGVPALALLDALLLLGIGLMAVALLLPERVQGRIQGIVTLVVSLLVLLGAIALLYTCIAGVMLMLGLLLAPIFGTIAYFVMFSDFDRAGCAVVLSLVMFLKIAFAVCLVLAQQRFLENKGLVLLIATSLLAVLIVQFLHGLVPVPLVAITDMIGAIVVAVLTLIWAVIFLVGAIISVVKAIV